ncbi:alpha-tocopherol transfer protein-like isoform X2 [Parasteatoda tepidariorum]|uniref:alpha-tocopherol transfer protein-like isoform X2 n=1 Tax=Parasteatoda tepidariorum TaxID=114398 RepID=UPI001C71809B|nr:alpha-tocopherol transfer protein-like isoform X2 [Parasteatoda tepidariorum]
MKARQNAEQLPKEEEEKALTAINESELLRKACMQTLKHMLKVQGFKPFPDEEFLLAHLRGSEFDCDRAAYSLLTFNELRRNSPAYFETCVLDALTKSHLNPLRISPFRLKDNSLLLISRYFEIDVAELPLPEKVYLDMISCFDLIRNPITQICGITFLMDAGDFTLSKIPQYTDYKWITTGSCVILSSSVRIKKIHVVNVSEAFISLYNALIPLMPKKVVDVLQFHSDSTEFKDLHEFIPPEILPEKYEGHLKECELIRSNDNILQKEDFFRKYYPL